MVKKFKNSCAEFSKPLNLSLSAMLLALSVILGVFANLSIPLMGTNTIKIGFNVVPIVLTAILYGPVVAGTVGGLSDIISFIISPMGGYIPGFTISFVLVGVVYGVFFYQEKVTLKRIIAAEIIVTLVINIFLGVLWFKIFYDMPIDKAFTIRGLKEIVDLPLSIFINYAVYRIVSKIPEFKRAKVYQNDLNLKK